MITLNGKRHKYLTADGLEVPGVTTVLAVAAKPQLIPWANKLGLDGVNVHEYNSRVTTIGSLTHAYIQAYLTNDQVDDRGIPSEVVGSARACFDKFMSWYRMHTIDVYRTELSIAGTRYGGTPDAFVSLDGVPTILDWKTSKRIYPEYFAQLAAYYYLFLQLQDLPMPIQVGVLLVDKEDGGAQIMLRRMTDASMDDAWSYFQACLQLYVAQKRLV